MHHAHAGLNRKSATEQSIMPDSPDDAEESLISQFETTLTIRPSAHDEEDVSMQTVLTSGYTRDKSIVDIDELEEEEINSEQIPKLRYKLKPAAAEVKRERGHDVRTGSYARLLLLLHDAHHAMPDQKQPILPELAPSPLVDNSLTRFRKVFDEFIRSNPHIEAESPRVAEKEKTLVVLSPLLAEHVIGRKWETKSYLATIFERPQRLLASCIGVGAALTMFPFYYKVINSTKRGSIFAPYVRRVHGNHWPNMLHELCIDSQAKLAAGKLEVPEDWNTGDIYLVPRTITAVEGSIGAIETAFDSVFGLQTHNLAFVLLRPPGHHCHASLPSGFCLLNNAQIGIEYAYEKHGVTHCAILDIDLHHGDGLQDICWERGGFEGDHGLQEDETTPKDEYGKGFASYPKVGYFSLHDIKSYPAELGYATKDTIRNASTCVMDHDVNIWNVHLQLWTSEDEFYKHYQTKYVAILNRANQFLNTAKKQYEREKEEYGVAMAKYLKYAEKPHAPQIKKPVSPPPFKPLIVISAGFDALEYENPQMQRHSVNVPTSFYATFTRDVVKLAKIHTGGKVVSFLEGGYSDGALSTGIFSHLIGLINNDEDDLWNPTWGSDQVMRELTKGCKKNWTPYKRPLADITIWANETIKIGRSLMPNAILASNYIYLHQPQKGDPDIPIHKMVREIMDLRTEIKIEDDDARRSRRLYYRRTKS